MLWMQPTITSAKDTPIWFDVRTGVPGGRRAAFSCWCDCESPLCVSRTSASTVEDVDTGEEHLRFDTKRCAVGCTDCAEYASGGSSLPRPNAALPACNRIFELQQAQIRDRAAPLHTHVFQGGLFQSVTPSPLTLYRFSHGSRHNYTHLCSIWSGMP